MIILVAETDIGMIIWVSALVIPDGSAMIAHLIHPATGMGIGQIGLHLVFAAVMTVGTEPIAPRINAMPVVIMAYG